MNILAKKRTESSMDSGSILWVIKVTTKAHGKTIECKARAFFTLTMASQNMTGNGRRMNMTDGELNTKKRIHVPIG
jgi:hypothetical protein